MSSNILKLNTRKIQFTCLGTSYQLAKVDASIFVVNGIAVDLLCSVTCLGVSIDQELTFADHIRSLACRCFFWIRQLRSVRRTLTSDIVIALVDALIISPLDSIATAFWLERTISTCGSCKVYSTPRRGETDSSQTEVRQHLVNNTRRPPPAANPATCRL